MGGRGDFFWFFRANYCHTAVGFQGAVPSFLNLWVRWVMVHIHNEVVSPSHWEQNTDECTLRQYVIRACRFRPIGVASLIMNYDVGAFEPLISNHVGVWILRICPSPWQKFRIISAPACPHQTWIISKWSFRLRGVTCAGWRSKAWQILHLKRAE